MKKSLFTIVAVLAVGFAKVALGYYFVYDSPFSLLVAAVGICAWYGGYLQGLLAYFLSVLFVIFDIAPSLVQVKEHQGFWIYGLCLFAVECFVVTAGCRFLKNSQAKAEKALRQLKVTDGSLRQSETRFRNIFDSNVIGLVFSDLEGQILDANGYFRQMVGYGKEEFIHGGLTWKELSPPEHAATIRTALKDIKVNSKIPPSERELIRADHSRVPVLIGSSMINPEIYVSFVLDISDKKKMEKALFELNQNLESKVDLRTRELSAANESLEHLIIESGKSAAKLRQSESFLESVIENIPNPIFVKDAKDLRYLRLNKAAERVLELLQDEVIGKRNHDVFPKEQADYFASQDQKVISTGKMTENSGDVYIAGKTAKFLQLKQLPIFSQTGKLQYILGIAEDVTEKRKNEVQRFELLGAQLARAEAEKSADRLKVLADATAALNESLDVETMLKSFSAVVVQGIADWCLIDLADDDSGLISRREETYRDPVLKVMATEYKQELDFLLSPQIVSAVADKRGEIYTPPPDKANMLSSAIIIPLIYYGKAFGAVTFVSTDSQKIFDAADLALGEDLTKRCALAVVNAQLYAKANEASRAKSAFLANISHEIRTPLGVMLGFAELAKDEGRLTGEQGKNMSAILRNGRHLLHLVDEILDISKVESERIQIEKIRFSLPRLVEDVLVSMRMRALEKGLLLTVKLSESMNVQVMSDPTRMRQILTNVIGNAIKFTDRGMVTVDARIHSEPQGNKHQLIINVEDTGVGISARESSNLFQPFVQVDGSMTRKFGGTGLGLFLSRKLARLLNGDVVLKQSRFGKGSQFLITLEVENPVQQITEAERADRKSDEGVAKGSVKMNGRVLVVDDSEDNQVLISAFLSNLGLSFALAQNGREGIDRALEETFDVVLMDIQMPEMDGFQALRALREMHYHKPIIAVTAHAMKGDRERCLAAGFDDYLSKPLSKTTLKQSLAKIFDNEAAAQM